MKRTTAQLQAHSPNFPVQSDQAPSLCIAVIGATGELARRKIFPALFALYYSGFLPEVVPQFLYLVRPLCLLSRVATARVFSFHQAYCFHCCSYYVFTFLNHSSNYVVMRIKTYSTCFYYGKENGMFQ